MSKIWIMETLLTLLQLIRNLLNTNQVFLNLFRMGFFWAAHGSVTLILQWWNLAAIIPYLRKKQKIYDPHDTPLEFCIFSLQISKFCYIKKHRYRFYFDIWFLILSNFFESIKIVLGNMVTISMMSVKMATLGLLKIAILK